ncbi:carbonic anhydrase [Streptomyces sp. DT2A-34]|uniref:carbonic anhydrase n=1 Tax=Streptomyces sp. DT2A-34 TaxID=3051182 RepID=UPI00265BF1FF|nr:carbonic anhydrase [Streptomyces sp. DT2A-34]MDO0913765.1 carbonic anhydrase [Streptomyces sp. DT2A-34]
MNSDRSVGSGPTSSAHKRFAFPSLARRTLLRAGLTGAAALGATAALGTTSAPATPTAPTAGGSARRPSTPAEALRELAAGNQRWRSFRERHPDESPTVRQALTSAQHPFAVILGCIDSRVPPELVFDQGLGDLFVVRSAGEVLDEAVLGSLAYGPLELGTPLIVVLGHQSCGAVKAAVEADESGERLPAHIQYLAEQIAPSIDHTKEGTARIDATINANVRAVRARLAAEPDFAARISTGELAIVGARYDLDTQGVHRVV